MTVQRKPPAITTMRKYYQLLLIIVCCVSVVTLLIYRHEYYRLKYVLEVLNFFGKPGLSEVEFCGPGFNATMLSEILRNSSMEVKETPPLFQEIDENFYTYSSFLQSHVKYEKLSPTNAHEIYTIAIGRANVEPKFRCNVWLDNVSKPKAGRYTYKIITTENKDFTLYVFHCTFMKDLGKPVAISYYKNDYNIDPIHAPISKVIQVNNKRQTRKSQSIKFVNTIEMAICVIPNKVPIVTRDAFIEFLIFHHMMGTNSYTIYDSMISEDIIRRLNLVPSDITHWDIQFFPLNYPFTLAKSYELVRRAIELDCLFRHFRLDKEDETKASHVAVLSWDEFLVPRLYNTLATALDDTDPTRKTRTFSIKPLLFCLNQNDDENSENGYPDVMKKTHYYTIPNDMKTVYIRNLDSMLTFDEIFNLESSKREISLDVLGVHKYTECRDPRRVHTNGSGYNDTQMQVFQHKFEGAMLKFAHGLMNNKVYRLYRTGKIWEKSGASDDVRDML